MRHGLHSGAPGEPAIDTWCILYVVKHDPLRIRLVSVLLIALLGIGAVGAFPAPQEPGRFGAADVFTCDWLAAPLYVDPQRMSPSEETAPAVGPTGFAASRPVFHRSSSLHSYGPICKGPLRDRLCVRLI